MAIVPKIPIFNTVTSIFNKSTLKCTTKKAADILSYNVVDLSILSIAQPHKSLRSPNRHLSTSTILLKFKIVIPGATKSKKVNKKQASSSKSSITLPNEAHATTIIDTPSLHSSDVVKSKDANKKVLSSSGSSRNVQNKTQAQTGIDEYSLQSSVKKSTDEKQYLSIQALEKIKVNKKNYSKRSVFTREEDELIIYHTKINGRSTSTFKVLNSKLMKSHWRAIERRHNTLIAENASTQRKRHKRIWSISEDLALINHIVKVSKMRARISEMLQYGFYYVYSLKLRYICRPYRASHSSKN